MQNFQDTFETRKWSFISAFLICMTVSLILKQIFWKTKIFLKKLEYHFLVESTKIETHNFHTKLPYQKPNGIVSIKWTYRKERSFASNYFVFLKIVFHFKNFL